VGEEGGLPLPPLGNPPSYESVEKMRRWGEEIEEVRREVLRGLTPDERDQYDLEHLKRLETMSGRITYARDCIDQRPLDKLRRLDPEFMEPIITGVEKRPAREKKKWRAIGRILQRMADQERQRER
jgi:hypothetical protein